MNLSPTALTEGQLETMHGLAPVVNALPGEQVPYTLEAGEGERYVLGPLHVTLMSRPADSGDAITLQKVTTGPLAPTPFVASRGHSFLHVTEGLLSLWFDGARHELVAGDSATVPAGSAMSIASDRTVTSFLLFTTDDGFQRLVQEKGARTEAHVFARRPAALASADLHAELREGYGLTVVDLERSALVGEVRDGLPASAEAFALQAGRGERLETFQQINAFAARGRHTGDTFFAMDTRGAKQPFIPRHFHKLHTENFLCLKGTVKIWANGEIVRLHPGDFLHAPAGTIHSFSLASHDTRMLGLLTTNVFEKFFEYMNEPTSELIYEEGGQPYFPAEGFEKARSELDLVVVGPPPEG